MSILYKGLNPKNHYGLCILTKDGELITADGKHYQAIQIPTPHGRLIDDVKKIIAQIEPCMLIATTYDEQVKRAEAVKEWLLSILEAER